MESWTASVPYPETARTADPPAAVRAPEVGDGPPVAVPGPSTDARPERAAQSRAEPGGHLNPPTVVLGEETAVGGPSPRHGVVAYRNGCRCGICRAAKAAEARHYRRLYREAVGGPSSHPTPRRWALTEDGLRVLAAPGSGPVHADQVAIPMITKQGLQEIAEQNRQALR